MDELTDFMTCLNSVAVILINGIQSLYQKTKHPTWFSYSTSTSILYLVHDGRRKRYGHTKIVLKNVKEYTKNANDIGWIENLLCERFNIFHSTNTFKANSNRLVRSLITRISLKEPSKLRGFESFGHSNGFCETILWYRLHTISQ